MIFDEEQREELKSIFRELKDDGMSPTRAQKAAAEVVATEVLDANDGKDPDPALVAMEAQMKVQSDKLDEFIKHLENQPSLKSAGYTTDDGGSADPDNKSFGDFLLAVKRDDMKRLGTIYKTGKVAWAKDILSQDGPGGGYLIPQEFHARLMEVSGYEAMVRPRAMPIPVSTDSGLLPALNQFTAPTAGVGNTAFAGGVVSNWVAPGATLTETQPTFEQIEYVIRKIAGFTEVENEALADSPLGIETLLTMLFGRTVQAMEDFAFLRGSGAAEPLGVLNAAVSIGISPANDNAFAYVDALTMRSRFRSAGGTPIWGIHPGVWPDIGIFEVSGGSGGVFQANLAAALNQNILGWDIVESEHLPQDDNAGNVLLADFRAYLIADRSQMAIAFSEHAAFTTDKGTWRFIKRLDGTPWMSGAITLADPQGSFTVSPFVFHND